MSHDEEKSVREVPPGLREGAPSGPPPRRTEPAPADAARPASERATARKKVLLTGAASGMGAVLLRHMADLYDVVGVDEEDLEDVHRSKIVFHQAALGKRQFEDILRRERPDALVHVSFRDDPKTPARVRHQTNVIGTMRLLDASQRTSVAKVVILSSAAVYGALPDNPTFMDETQPLRASQTYSGLRDRVEVDTYAQAWMYKNRDVRTIILRPANVLGPTVHSSFRSYIELPRVPVLAGFDPMMQIIHEDDVARAIIRAVDAPRSGIYNLAGSGSALPLSTVLAELGVSPFPVPYPLALPLSRALWALGLSGFPPPQIDFLRYPQVVSGVRAREDLGFEPEIQPRDCLAAMRRALSSARRGRR